MFQPWVDTFTSEVMIHPVTNRPEHKRSFIPSLWEKREVCTAIYFHNFIQCNGFVIHFIFPMTDLFLKHYTISLLYNVYIFYCVCFLVFSVYCYDNI